MFSAHGSPPYHHPTGLLQGRLLGQAQVRLRTRGAGEPAGADRANARAPKNRGPVSSAGQRVEVCPVRPEGGRRGALPRPGDMVLAGIARRPKLRQDQEGQHHQLDDRHPKKSDDCEDRRKDNSGRTVIQIIEPVHIRLRRWRLCFFLAHAFWSYSWRKQLERQICVVVRRLGGRRQQQHR